MFYEDLCYLRREWKQVTGSLVHSLRWGELVPYMGLGVGVGPGVSLGALPIPLVMLVQGSCMVSSFYSGHLRRGSWVFGVLYLICNLPHLPMHAVIFSPLDCLSCCITSSSEGSYVPGCLKLILTDSLYSLLSPDFGVLFCPELWWI